jgi:WASH complex subunit 7
MYFTDDGFAMGISYCLAILKQTKKNDSLHWIDSTRAKQAIDAKKLDDQQMIRNAKEKQRQEAKEAKIKASSSFFGLIKGNVKPDDEEEDDYEDMEEIHSLQLTGKRLEATRRETDQLFFSMSGAGIFFKRTDVDT